MKLFILKKLFFAILKMKRKKGKKPPDDKGGQTPVFQIDPIKYDIYRYLAFF